MAEEHSEVQVSSVSEFFTQGLEEIDLNVNGKLKQNIFNILIIGYSDHLFLFRVLQL